MERFNDIIEAVAAMDADAISIETSRFRMELLDAFVRFRYPNEIGPGAYDINSLRVPDEARRNPVLPRRRRHEQLKGTDVIIRPDRVSASA